MQNVLKIVDDQRRKRFLKVTRGGAGHLCIEQSPAADAQGLYWFYTSYSEKDIKSCVPSRFQSAIQMDKLADLHCGLEHICKESLNGYRLVYNGRAGSSGGLGARIRAHFRGSNKTGCLSIGESTLNDLDRWRVSYVSFEDLAKTVKHIKLDYKVHASALERMWRLQYGWPLLCRI